MARASRRKGADHERAIVTWLRSRGRPHIERRIAGMNGDRGDLTGWPGVVVEAKNCKTWDVSGWVNQLEDEILEAGADTGAVVIKPPRVVDPGRYYAVMTLERWEALMTEAGR
jgi:hypothetical protein